MLDKSHPDIAWRKRKPSKKMMESIRLYDLGLRHCVKCDEVKSLSLFSKQSKHQFGINNKCKECVALSHDRNKRAEIYRKNKEKSAAQYKAWRAANMDKIRESRRALDRKRRSTPEGLLVARLKCAIRDCIRRGDVKSRTMAIIGYTPEELKKHLEAQFLKGMSWDNASKWHIDHIVPLSAFDFKNGGINEIKRAWAISNLRPIWAEDNIRKHAKRIFLI